MRNPSQVLLLAVLMASLILPPVLPATQAAADGAAPTRERHILLVGDSLSIGLGKQLETLLAGQPGVHFAHLGKVSSGLANPAFFDWDAQLTAQVKQHHPDMVLIMVGANDDKPLPVEGKSAAFGTKDWDSAYAKRLAKLHAIVRADNPQARVYYIGVPVMGDSAFNTEMLHMNAVLAKTANTLPDTAFIDVHAVLADASGAFAPFAKLPDGDVVKLRAKDGVHITATGSQLLAARCLEAISGAASLPKEKLLAALDDRQAQPLATANTATVRVAELRQPRPAAQTPSQPAPKTQTVAAAKTSPAPSIAPAAPKKAAQTTPAGTKYTVADGDTLWTVAKRVGVSPDTLASANPGIDPRHMSIGATLAVPAATTDARDQPRQANTANASGRSHVVADGENIWSVARQYNVTVAALTKANPTIEPTKLRIGQELAIPAAKQATQVAGASGKTSGNRYVVADGDNFWIIAHHLGIDVSELTRANASVNPQKLQPGQVLTLPGVARAERGRQPTSSRESGRSPKGISDAALYPVAKGDTLWALSRRFGVDLDSLLSANGEVDPSHLHVGQLVTIPGNQPVASAETLVFPVSTGDTLWTIARRFDVSVAALLAANPGVDPLRLHEGQTVHVPTSLAAVATSGPKDDTAKAPTAPAATASPAALNDAVRRHTVSSGDTVWDLSRRYGISVARILSENSGIDPLHLRVGQIVRLPNGAVMAAR